MCKVAHVSNLLEVKPIKNQINFNSVEFALKPKLSRLFQGTAQTEYIVEMADSWARIVRVSVPTVCLELIVKMWSGTQVTS